MKPTILALALVAIPTNLVAAGLSHKIPIDPIINNIIDGEKDVPATAPLSGIDNRVRTGEWCLRYPDSLVCGKIGGFGDGLEKDGSRLLSRFEVKCRESGYLEIGCRKFVREVFGTLRGDGEGYEERGAFGKDSVERDVGYEVHIDYGEFSGNTFSHLYPLDY